MKRKSKYVYVIVANTNEIIKIANLNPYTLNNKINMNNQSDIGEALYCVDRSCIYLLKIIRRKKNRYIKINNSP